MTKEFYAPETPEKALELKKNLKKSFFLGGGTIINAGKKPAGLNIISLHKLNLKYIRQEEKGIEVGAMTTVSELADSGALDGKALKELGESCRHLSKTIRNMATIGGSLGSLFSKSDIIPVLMVLNTSVNVLTETGPAALPIEDYVMKRSKGAGYLIQSIFIPSPCENAVLRTARSARSSNDLPTLKTALYYSVKENKYTDVKIAAGGVMNHPARLIPLETALEGKPVGETPDWEEFLNLMTPPPSDIRGGSDFKTSMLRALLEDIFT